MKLADYGLRLLRVYEETIIDGDGLRYSFYLSGCRHQCPFCQNPESWNPAVGQLLTDEVLEKHIQNILDNPLLSGITLSGGDPFFNPSGLLALLKILKGRTGANIWCYTGYTLESLARSSVLLAPLEYIDVLVDGPFIKEIRDQDIINEVNGGEELLFRGSSNQRIIYNPYSVARNWLETGDLRIEVPN